MGMLPEMPFGLCGKALGGMLTYRPRQNGETGFAIDRVGWVVADPNLDRVQSEVASMRLQGEPRPIPGPTGGVMDSETARFGRADR
jgi:hypothetical protein